MGNENRPKNYGALWTRDHLILAFDLYCRIPFKETKANNPEVVKLARMLRRSPAGVARKLGNFGSFDPDLQKRQITGLIHTGKLDREIWSEFNDNWNELVLEARRIRNEFILSGETDETSDAIWDIPEGKSETLAVHKRRIHQSFFREAVLSSYDETCCITGLKIKECLVASHIIPWSVSEKHRADPRNGLCFSATFDRLFDSGYISISDSLAVIVSSSLRNNGDRVTMNTICKYDNAPIMRPRRFSPLIASLEWHRNNIFRH